MGKAIYSLVLSEEVVRAIDARAHRQGTNRSALIDRILAEYVSVSTAEGMIRQILGDMSRLLSDRGELVPQSAPGGRTLAVKSALNYKYRPTVKYEIGLDRSGRGVGELAVTFRTQSAQLLGAITEFFRLWCRIEEAVLPPRHYAAVGYSLADGRFTRSLILPEAGSTAVAEAIAAYIRLFDRTMKGFLCGELSSAGVLAEYETAKGRAPFLL